MQYIPITEKEKKEMLSCIGKSSVNELFRSIPDELLLKESLKINHALGENEVADYMNNLASENCQNCKVFLGAGAYRHFVPSLVSQMLLRSEFYTAYTPYQPEISQGTLQNIFEFQTMMCQLTGMDVSNASLYDGSTGLAEALMMAARIKKKRNKIIVSEAIHPEYLAVMDSYLKNYDVEVERVAFDSATGKTDVEKLKEQIDDNTICVAIQSPNFFGVIEDIQTFSDKAHEKEALSVAIVAEAMSLGLLKPPGELGADIVAGEMQSFGNPLNFGGPYLGFMTCLEKYKRQMPGRIVGQTEDKEGTTGFVLTLATREQHIRREKATSNICSNEALCALAAAMTMSCFGRKGMRRMAEINTGKAHYTAEKIASLNGYDIAFTGPFFNEFTVKCSKPAGKVLDALKEKNLIGGYALSRDFKGMDNYMLICVTEMTPQEDIDLLVSALEAVK